MVILPKEKLKRSRTARTEITNYSETVKWLDIVLENLKPSTKKITNKSMKNKKLSEIHSDNKLFKFGLKAAEQFLKRASEKANVRCQPGGDNVTWKNLRSSMSCDLLRKDWSRDEVNARLGHKPSSRVIDKYINYFALDRRKPKKKVYEGNLKKVESELNETREFTKLQAERIRKQKKEMENMKKKIFVLDKSLEEINGLPEVFEFIKMIKATGGLNGKQIEELREKSFEIQ